MRRPLTITAALLPAVLTFAATPAFALHRHAARASFHHGAATSSRSSRSLRAAVTHHPTAAMEPERATAIQQALIKAGYLQGEPTGAWDSSTVTALQKLQGDNGWQTKWTPDSRALIKLGLGPQGPANAVTATSPTTPISLLTPAEQ